MREKDSTSCFCRSSRKLVFALILCHWTRNRNTKSIMIPPSSIFNVFSFHQACLALQHPLLHLFGRRRRLRRKSMKKNRHDSATVKNNSKHSRFVSAISLLLAEDEHVLFLRAAVLLRCSGISCLFFFTNTYDSVQFLSPSVDRDRSFSERAHNSMHIIIISESLMVSVRDVSYHSPILTLNFK